MPQVLIEARAYARRSNAVREGLAVLDPKVRLGEPVTETDKDGVDWYCWDDHRLSVDTAKVATDSGLSEESCKGAEDTTPTKDSGTAPKDAPAGTK